jgi:hypothetical protein
VSDPRDVERARKAAERIRKLLDISDDEQGCEHLPNEDFLCWHCQVEIFEREVLRALEDVRREDREEIERLRRQVYRERDEALEAAEREVDRLWTGLRADMVQLAGNLHARELAGYRDREATIETLTRDRDIARKWSARWKKLADWRGWWPASRHEQNRRSVARAMDAAAAQVKRLR